MWPVTHAPELPALLALAPHRPLLHRGPGARVIGLGPDTGQVVDDLSAPLAAMLDALVVPVERDELLARAVEAGAERAAATGLLAELVDAGAVVDAATDARTRRRRGGAVVLVEGDGPLAVGIACGLGLAGVGTVQVGATGSVRASDLGTGYLDADRGRPRGSAAAAALRRLAPSTRVRGPARLAPDLVVLADAAGTDARSARALVGAGVMHLQARLRDGHGVVGPLVLPGRSACLCCLHHVRAEQQPGWAAVTSQLAGVQGGADAATAAATAGLATAQALAALDGQADPPPVLDATLELDVAAGTLVRRRWPAHPACGCGAAERPRPAGRPGPRRDATCTPGPRQETIIV